MQMIEKKKDVVIPGAEGNRESTIKQGNTILLTAGLPVHAGNDSKRGFTHSSSSRSVSHTPSSRSVSMRDIKNMSFPKSVIGNLNLKKVAEVPDTNPRGRRHIHAFTLIELLVVVLIIGILSAIALPQYQTAVDKARYTTMMTTVRALKDAQNLYYLANGSYTTDAAEFEGILPAECEATSTTVTCPKFTLTLESTRLYARSRQSPKNAFMMYYQPLDARYNILCYAYAEDGERGRRLCKSVGGIQTSESENSDCGKNCTHYQL